MAAVLEDALRVIRDGVASPARRRGAVFVETMEWLVSDDLAWPFSFRNLCTALDVNAQCLRKRIAHVLAATSPAACRSTHDSVHRACLPAHDVLTRPTLEA